MKTFKYIFISLLSMSLLLIGLILYYRPYLIKNVPIKKIDCSFENIPNRSHKLNDKLSTYIDYASKNGIKKCKTKSEFKDRELIKIIETEHYVVAPLTSSYPYLSTSGKALLDSIGYRFGNKLKNTPYEGVKLVLSSLTRTEESVKGLMKWNSNAVKNSPHLYGGTFDIKYKSFYKPFTYLSACNKTQLESILAEVLLELKQENLCWVLKEKKHPCFHVVSRI